MCIPQTWVKDNAYNTGYDDGAASITPEDGIGQTDVDNAYNSGYDDGAASITPEDGIGQTDVEIMHTILDMLMVLLR